MQFRPIEETPSDGAGARIGFGCASLGNVLDFKGKCRIIESAYEAGFRHFDVAPSYGQGEAESALGEVLASVRRNVTIVTKVGIAHPRQARAVMALRRLAAPIKTHLPWAWRLGSHQANALTVRRGVFGIPEVTASLEESLRRLKCASVDALLLHEVTQDDLTSELLATLQAWVARGAVGALGTGTGLAETQRIAGRHPGVFGVFQVNHYWGSRTEGLQSNDTTLVTHRCIKTGIELLAEPILRSEMETHPRAADLMSVYSRTRDAGKVLLVAALKRQQPRGFTLVSTSRPEGSRELVEAAKRCDLNSIASAVNECLDKTFERISGTDASSISR